MSDHDERVVRTEVLGPEPTEALANLLGVEVPSDAIPPLWHWIYLLERRPHADLGRVSTHATLVLGQPATRTTLLVDSLVKQGRTGPLTFVTVRNEYSQNGRVAIVDENDIVYRGAESSLRGQVRLCADL